jgi:AcrR family transcriptional regulator
VQTREHVLEVAHELFYWNGIRATGVDRVAAAAGVAPTTLYRVFESKDDLVAAYVDRADRLSRERLMAAADGAGADPVDRVLAVFDELVVQREPDRCRGCALVLTLAEYPDPALPAHERAVAGKQWIRDYLAHLAGGIPGLDAAAAADQLVLIIEGANASAAALGVDGPIQQARAMAQLVLSAAVPAADAAR